MAKLAVKRIPGNVGCEIENLDLRFLDDSSFDTIESALHEHLVAILPRQSIGPKSFLALANRFGRPEPHVINQFHHPVDPNILVLSNRRNDKGEPIGLADGGTYFHTDYSYLPVPARCTLLFAQEIPDGKSGTTFANQRKAYEDLDDATKAKLEGLVCRHHYGNRDNLDEASRTAASKLNDAQKAKMDWVRHPLVRKHPHTGKKSLYAVSGSSFAIEGMGDNEGRALLDDLKTHATQDKYCGTPTYKSGDVIIWDNCSLLHSAPLVDETKPRTLWRITVKEAGATL